MEFFTELEQIIPKFLWKHKISQIAKTIFRKKRKTGDIILSNFKLYYKATVLNRVLYWQTHKKDTQINKTGQKTQKLSAYICGQLIYDKGGKKTQQGKDNLSINSAGKTEQLYAKDSNQTPLSCII